MFFSVTLCLVTYIIQLCNTHSSLEEINQFECGAHGKFEYCLNGLAGCVIGCHCHPGYYFDTDTKICEPNTKLTRDIRRRYMQNPSRTYDNNPTTVTEDLPTLTTAYDPLSNDNGKDNDNLGDWLYNQFFKTIETQIINKTKDDQPTRRSGNDHGTNRRDGDDKKIQKKFKSKNGKKKKNKVHGLRRKLLRITEDDSLFDSDENSSECSGHSSDSDDDNSNESSESLGESKEQKDGKKDSKDDRHHDHKKVIIFNKRPRPPLPSFIFMPSMDTPFYPPIGLPPPPILPMYPMIPIPPMPAPFVPHPGTEQNNSNSATTAATPHPDSGPTSNTESTEPISTDETTITTESPPEEADDPKVAERSKFRPHKSRKVIPTTKSSDETFMVRSRQSEPRIPWTHQQVAQLKLAQKFREKLKNRLKNASPDLKNIALNEETLSDEVPPEDDSSIYTPIAKPKHKPRKKQNFQYLSQLIHKLNNTNEKPHSNGISDDLKEFKAIKSGRRNYDPNGELLECENELALSNNSRRLSDGDNYYTNLGRKIACLVRSIEPKVSENNIENSKYNAYNYPAPSFWERYVRSPLKTFKNRIGRFDKYSGEKNLLSLENEVSYIASTTPPLSLQDLENILSTLHKFHSHTTNSKNPSVSSSASYNVDLLQNKPLEILPSKPPKPVMDYSYFNGLLDDSVYIPRVKTPINDTLSTPYRWTSHSNITHFLDVDRPINDEWTIKYEQNVASEKLLPKFLEPNTTNNNFERFEREHEHEHPYRLYDNVDNTQFVYLKINTPLPNPDTYNRRKLEHYPKYSDIYSNIYELPLKYRKSPMKVEKYLQVPGKQPEISANSYDHRLKEYQDISQVTQTNDPNEQNSDIMAKLPNSGRMEKYGNEPGKYARLTKYPEYPVIFAKYPHTSKQIPAKYAALLHKYPDLLTKYPDLFAKYHELLSKNLPQKFHELLAQQREATSKFADMLPKYTEMLTKYPNTPPEYSTPRKNGYSTIYPTLRLKYPLHTRRNVHPPLYRKRRKQVDTNPKRSNYFFDLNSERNHYVIEDISLTETEDKEALKGYAGDTSKSSFFHHDLQHLPYFD